MSAPMERPETGVVLVPGAWFAPEAWSAVLAGLEELGVAAVVATLHRGSLGGDTRGVIEALDHLGGAPAVVCGHSYGGAVITGLPPERVAHLVYLAAVMPAETENTLGLAESESSRLSEMIRPTDRPNVTRLDPDLVSATLFNHSDPEAAARHAAALVPQDMTAGHQTPARAAWRSVPSTYVVCEEDLTLSPVLQRRLASRAGEVLTWACDHTPFLHQPERIAALLAGLAISFGDDS